jgi:oligosaccharide translocation protein RFT1
MPDNAVSASAKGASFLILLQIGSRAVTFALNQILLRFLSPELLGISVQLELFKIGVQYFSRESLRVAAERRSDGGVQAAVNLSYLAILANIPLGFTFAHWYLSNAGSYMDVPYFAEALRVNQLAAFVELLMEPAFTVVQQNMLYKARAAAEGSSVILKTLTVFALFIWSSKQGLDLGVLPFAIGELVNSFTQTAVYWAWTAPTAKDINFSLFPHKLKSRCVEADQLSSVGVQSVDRFILVVRKSNTSLVFSRGLCYGSLALFSSRPALNGCSPKAINC